MKDSTPVDISQNLSAVWGKLMTQRQHNAAMLTGVLSYLISLETQDVGLKTGAVALIRKTAEEILETIASKSGKKTFSSQLCAFCGRGEPEVKLAAGADAFICASCVSNLAESFSNSTGDDHRK